ncbi:unnamed protein product [Protopolystoma xenopodis]|uniref:Uncharacterized protein n=1 Tax=Protopolystoma xenopodis TaxID=117903 RepID=A0A3S5A7U8_9PLAT|nr:unnamed protein product [Protopolystoma xenopodis]
MVVCQRVRRVGAICKDLRFPFLTFPQYRPRICLSFADRADGRLSSGLRLRLRVRLLLPLLLMAPRCSLPRPNMNSKAPPQTYILALPPDRPRPTGPRPRQAGMGLFDCWSSPLKRVYSGSQLLSLLPPTPTPPTYPPPSLHTRKQACKHRRMCLLKSAEQTKRSVDRR